MTEKFSRNRVMIKLDVLSTVDRRTASGIWLPDNSNIKQKQRTGTVKKLGTKCNGAIKIGQKVIFPSGGGQEYVHDGVQYIIFSDNEIWGYFNG